MVCKTLERLIVEKINLYLNSNALLSSEQFGFRAGYSTVDLLILTYDYVTKTVDDHKVVDLVFFDYTKAFDLVSHQIVLEKLRSIGVSGYFLE